jgi:putative peptidoglycan lipid II flippase
LPGSKKTILVFGFVGLSHVLLVVRDLLLAHQFGNGPDYEAFMVTMIVPTFLISVFTSAIGSSLVPKIVQKAHSNSHSAFAVYVSSTFFALTICIAAICIFLGLTHFLWHGPMIASLSETQKIYAKSLIAPTLILTFLQAVPVFLRVLLTATHRQILATFSPVLNLVFLAFFLFFFRPENIQSYVTQLSLAYLLELIFIFSACVMVFKMTIKFNLSKQLFRELFDRHFWYPISSSILGASFLLVDQVMAARLPQGGVAALNYGQKITSAMIGVVSTAMGSLIFPTLSSYVSQKNWTLFRHTVRKYTIFIFCSSTLVTLILCFFSYDIVQLLFERGAFKNQDTILVSQINTFYLLQIPFYLVGQIAIKSLYSMQKGFYMTHIAMITIFINAIGNYLFSLWLGLPGISLSTSLVFALSSIAVFVYLGRELKSLDPQ